MSDSKKALGDLVLHIRAIADDQFDGDIENNFIDIFNMLTDDERYIVIHQFVRSQFLFTKGSLVKDVRAPSTKKIEKELQDIEEFNKIELIRLKSWLARATLVLALSFSFLAMMISGTSLKEYMKDVFHVWDVISK